MDKLVFEAFYPHPVERVWEAITDPTALAKWLMSNDFSPLAGTRFTFQGDQGTRTAFVQGSVLDVKATRSLRLLWDDGEAGAPSIVTWTLRPQDGGTQVRLEHEALEQAEPYVLIEANLNWRLALYASLPALLKILGDRPSRPPVPIVYMPDDPESENPRRAGFRQPEEVVK